MTERLHASAPVSPVYLQDATAHRNTQAVGTAQVAARRLRDPAGWPSTLPVPSPSIEMLAVQAQAVAILTDQRVGLAQVVGTVLDIRFCPKLQRGMVITTLNDGSWNFMVFMFALPTSSQGVAISHVRFDNIRYRAEEMFLALFDQIQCQMSVH